MRLLPYPYCTAAVCTNAACAAAASAIIATDWGTVQVTRMGLADIAVKAVGEVQLTPAGDDVKVTVPSNISARVRIAVTEEPGVLVAGLKLKLVMAGT